MLKNIGLIYRRTRGLPAGWRFRWAAVPVIFTICILCSLTGWAFSHAFGLNFNKNLPVKITVFTATYNPGRQVVDLHWITTMEKNNEHFVIERSLDSLHFVVIGKARSVGNSHISQHYYFDDPKPVGGKMYYRLREIDSSGKQFLTTVVSAYMPVTRLEITGIRPSANGMELGFAVISPQLSLADVVVVDIEGHVLKSYLMKIKEGANLQSIYVGDLKPGIYFLQVNDQEGNGSVMGKFTHKVSGMQKAEDKKEPYSQ